MKRVIIIIGVAVCCLYSQLCASTSQETVGARPSAMGGAFVGVADDGNALYWNPAGMAFLSHHEVTSMYSDLFGLDIANNYVSYTYPVTGRFAAGFDWFNLGFDDPELDYSFNKFNLGGSYKVTKSTSIGTSLKYLNTSTAFDGRSIGKGNGWTGDLGFLYKLSDRFSAGVVVNNLFNGGITYDNGAQSQIYDMGVRAGVGYRPVNELLLAADLGDRLHLGSEYLYHEILALRAGLQRDLKREKETVLSFGFGLRFNAFQVDYSYTSYPHLDHTSRISFSAFFNFGRSLVRIGEVKLASSQGLFPALWNTYRESPFLEFELENRSDKPLECTWEVDVAEMTDAPTSGTVALRPKETMDIRASAQFSDRFYSNPSDIFGSGDVTVNYVYGRNKKRNTKKYQTFVYAKGAIDWNAGVERIGSFINPQDPQLRAFTKMLVDEHSDLIDANSPAANIHYAMAIHNGLKSYGLKYLPDPNNPFANIREKAGAIDDVQYPVELLNSRLGDCDDLTALFCAMLESIGIKTVVIDVPGHLYMMFDAGIPIAYRVSLMLDDGMLVDYNRRVYIPLEVTEVQSSFIKAWSAGAAEYLRWTKLDELQHIDLRDAWSVYPPAPFTQELAVSDISSESAHTGMLADRSALDELNEQYLEQNYYRGMNRLSSDPDVLNRAAVTQIFNGNMDAGESTLRRALALDGGRSDIRANLANVLGIKGEFPEASELYENLDPEWITRESILNLIMARCLSIDLDSLSLLDSLNSFVRSIKHKRSSLADSVWGDADLSQCFEGLTTKLDLAICVKTALESQGRSTEGSVVGSIEKLESIETRVRLFQWYY